MNATRILIASILILALVIGTSAYFVVEATRSQTAATAPAAKPAAATTVEGTDEATGEATGEAVRNYLLENPEIIETALMALQAKRAEQAKAERSHIITQMQDQIFNSPNQMVLGNPEGEITLVEFFDYNCGYCKRAFPDMVALIESNPDLRMVMKEFPILSEGSLEAARIAVAVHTVAPERYVDFHKEMMTRNGQADRAKAMQVVQDLDLDAAAVEREAAADAVDQHLSEVQAIAGALDISGTPSYVIGDQAVPGAVGFDQLQQMIIAARKCGGESLTC
ncbi:DsbA family protein [Afifella pfennigii]|uniref:DsbA family protein n=1 Tax=Afifella pfennigii TaxID=209897 RepID=UPI00068B898C|nr:DsbA family protein [Afifella pfennigii]